LQVCCGWDLEGRTPGTQPAKAIYVIGAGAVSVASRAEIELISAAAGALPFEGSVRIFSSFARRR
jgi:hypothetical protein